jgi:hypothetical protein
MHNLTYSLCEGVCDFFTKWGSFGFRGVDRLVTNIRGMPGVVGWPGLYTNMFLVTSRDLKFRVSDKCIKGLVPPDKEPGVVDEFEGEVLNGYKRPATSTQRLSAQGAEVP